MADAVIEVTSPDHFKDLLNQDLNRVSVINFWASFAEPCKQMNEVFKELAKKYGSGLFLSVRPLLSALHASISSR